MSDQKKSSWPYWVAAGLILLPVFYVLSLGPLVWLNSRDMIPPVLMGPVVLYVTPFEWGFMLAPEWCQDLLKGYADLWRQ